MSVTPSLSLPLSVDPHQVFKARATSMQHPIIDVAPGVMSSPLVFFVSPSFDFTSTTPKTALNLFYMVKRWRTHHTTGSA